MGTQTLLTGVATAALNVANAAANAPANGQAFALPSSAGFDIFWDVITTGTALATIQVDLQGSMDAAFTNPIQIDTENTLGNKGQFVTGKQCPFMRARLVAATGGDATSTVAVRVYIKKRGADV